MACEISRRKRKRVRKTSPTICISFRAKEMPTRGPIIASAGFSMHSRWAQLSLLHPRKTALFFSPPRDCNRPSFQPRETATTTTTTTTRYTYTLPTLNSFVRLAFPSRESAPDLHQPISYLHASDSSSSCACKCTRSPATG